MKNLYTGLLNFLRISRKGSLIAILLFGFTHTQAQLAVWNPLWSGVAASPLAASSLGTNIASGSLARVGLTGVSSGSRYNSSGWNTTSNYLTITVTPSAGYLLNLNSGSVVLNMGSSNTGPNSYLLFSSVDGYASAITTVSTPCPSTTQGGNITYSLPATGYNNLSSVTFRIVANGTTSCNGASIAAGGTGGPSYISVNGTTTVTTPVITSLLTHSATYGIATTYNITASNAPTSYSASGLPAGLSVNTSTGAITGTPSAAPNTYNVTIGASNGGGAGPTSTLVITISPKPITITATGPAKVYGTGLADGTYTTDFTVSGGMAFSETITSVFLTMNAAAALATTNAGLSYVVTPSSAAGGGGFLASNYSITYTAFNGTVSPKPINVTANTYYKAFGNTIAASISGLTDFTVTGLVGGQTIGTVTLNFGTGRLAGDGVGTYVNQVTPSAATGGTFNISNYTITYVPGNLVVSATIPVISVSGTLATVNTASGTASASTSFNVSGVNMLAGILITPPAGYEVSLDNITFSPTVTVGAAGTIASTTVYVRIAAATAPGVYSGFVVCSSTSAANENIATSPSTVTAITPVTQASNITFTATGSQFFTVNWTNGSGGRRSVFIKQGAGAITNPTNGVQYADNSIFGSGAQLGASGYYCVYDGQGSSVAVTGLTAGTTYYVQVFEYNSDNNAAPTPSFISYNVTTATNNPNNFTTPSPTINTNPATVTGFAYYFGYGPSFTLTYTLNATNLTTAAGNITVTAPTNYELSVNNSTFSNSLSIAYTGYALADTLIYIRLKAGLAIGGYNGELITNSGGGAANKTVTCNGNVLNPPVSTPIVEWEFASLTGGTNNFGPSPHAYAYLAPNVTTTNLIRGSGIGTTGTGASFAWGGNTYSTAGTGGSATAITANSFHTFGVTVAAGYTMSLSSIQQYNIRRSGTGPAYGIWQYSINAGAYVNIGSELSFPISTSAGNVMPEVPLLGIAALQNLLPGTSVTFRLVLYGATAAGGTGYINTLGNAGQNDLKLYGRVDPYCASPDMIEFVQQPTTVKQDDIMTPAVTVRAYCSGNGGTATGYSGTVTLTSANAPNYGCGITGALTQPFFNGIATFSNIVITRSQQDTIKLIATATGIAGTVTSDTFSVLIPGGSLPGNTELIMDDFEGSVVWGRSTGSATYYGTGGTAGANDFTGVKSISGNKSFVKSYLVNNASKELGSRTTTTFNNVTFSPVTYNHVTFTFKVASLGDPGFFTGAGVDGNEQMLIETSLDGGTVWNKLITYNGTSDYLFPYAVSPVTSLAYNSNAIYTSPSALSSFSVQLPSGSSQFRFRITANNNRTNENWAIDSVRLVGTAVASAGVQSPLPIVTNNSVTACPSSSTTITVVTNNTVGAVAYNWTPATFISNTAISNPVVNPPGAAIYTANITDADGCKASGTVSITIPGGTTGSWVGANNSDWFQCGNWGGGVVPIASTNVTIPAGTPIAEIDPLSTYAAAFGSIAYANNILIYDSLRLQSNAVLTVAGNLSINTPGTALIDMTNGGQINLSGSWTNNVGATGFISGLGTINYTSAASQTIALENYYNLTISSNGSRTLPAGTIGVAGAFTKAGSNTYSFTSGNIVNYNGAAQNIAPFTAGVSTGATYDNLTLSNTGIKTVTGNTDVESDFTINDNVQLSISNNTYITLKSTATKTARVAPVSATFGGITYPATGGFIIERYYPGSRSWRLITAPVTVDGTKSIFNSWQVGANNSLPGLGTYVTGPGETAANGLDVSPAHNYSMKTFNQATSSFDGLGNTKTTLISGTAGVAGTPDNKGFFMFVRGDRTISNPDPFNQWVTPNSTTLKDTGRIQYAGYSFPCNTNTGTHRYTLIGNPYASPVDFTTLARNNVDNKFRAWDPTLNTVGGYAYWDGSTIAPVISKQTTIIQSKQAFVVETTNSSLPSISFAEANKSSSNNLLLFRPAPGANGMLIVNLFTVSNGDIHPADGIVAKYNDDYDNGTDRMDMLKFTNINETFSIESNNATFAIERRKPLTKNDVVQFNFKRTRQLSYRFEIRIDDIVKNRNLQAYLEDKYLTTRTALNMNGTTWVDFEVNSDAASAVVDRFRIVFKKITGFNHINANMIYSDVLVNWSIENETTASHYEVERSSDGNSFTKISDVNATEIKPLLSFCYTDIEPAAGTYYYRIKAVNEYGAYEYSDVAKVKVVKVKGQMYVYPNPVINGTIALQMGKAATGLYNIRLLNTNGQAVLSKQLQHITGTSTEFIYYSQALGKGTYQLEVTGADKKKNIVAVAIAGE